MATAPKPGTKLLVNDAKTPEELTRALESLSNDPEWMARQRAAQQRDKCQAEAAFRSRQLRPEDS